MSSTASPVLSSVALLSLAAGIFSGGVQAQAGPVATDRIDKAIGRLAIMDQSAFELAIRRLASMGKHAVPQISKVVKDKGYAAQVRNGCLQALARMGDAAKPALDAAIVALGDEVAILRAQSLVLIGRIGAPEARKALPVVQGMLADKDVAVRRLALYVSTLLTPDRAAWMPKVLAGLDDKADSVKHYALRTLQEFYTDKAAPFFDRVLPQVASDDAEVSRSARTLIASMGDAGLPRVIQVLEDDESSLEYRLAMMEVVGILRPVRREAVVAMMRVYRKLDANTAKAVVNTMRRLDGHVVGDVAAIARDASAAAEARLRAMELLGTIGNASASEKAVFLEFLSSEDAAMQRAALESISRIRAGVPGVAQAVTGFLRGDARELRVLAAGALRPLGDEARCALPVVRELLEDEEPGAMKIAIAAIDSLGARALELAPDLLRALEHEDAARRMHAVDAMARVGPEITEPLLEAMKTKTSVRFRRGAVLVFQALGPSVGNRTPGVVAALSEVLAQPEEVLQRDAAFSLGRLGARASDALPRLERLAIDGSPEVRVAALGALHAIAGGEARVLAVIERCLEARASQVRWAAIEALGVEGSKAAVPILIRFVTSEDKIDRIKAGHALGRVGRVAQDAVPVIEKQLREEVETEVTLALANGANAIKGLKRQ